MSIVAKTKFPGSKQDIPVTFLSCEIEEAGLSGLEVGHNKFSKYFLFWEGTVLKTQC